MKPENPYQGKCESPSPRGQSCAEVTTFGRESPAICRPCFASLIWEEGYAAAQPTWPRVDLVRPRRVGDQPRSSSFGTEKSGTRARAAEGGPVKLTDCPYVSVCTPDCAGGECCDAGERRAWMGAVKATLEDVASDLEAQAVAVRLVPAGRGETAALCLETAADRCRQDLQTLAGSIDAGDHLKKES